MATVPMSSVITGLDTYAFTVITACLLLAAGAACLLLHAFRWSNHRRRRRWFAAYDVLLVVLVITAVAAFHKRLTAMEQVTTALSLSTDEVFVDLLPACHMHAVCIITTTTLTAATLLKLSIMLWPAHGWPPNPFQ